MVAIVKKSTSPLCRLATPKVFVAITLVVLFLIVSWQIPTLLPFIYTTTTKYDIEIDHYNFQDDIKELKRAIKKLQGDDLRLVQWDATKHTKKYQPKICPSMLPNALTNLMDVTSILQQLPTEQQQLSAISIINLLQVSLEICTLCITDNPTNRDSFSKGKEHETQDDNDTAHSSTLTIHDAVVSLLRFPSLTPYAAHLIYIASFANRDNYHGFVEAQAVATLTDIFISQSEQTTPPYTFMWVAAALQNLAASYCTTPEDGRCYWEWKKQEKHTVNSNTNDKKNEKKEERFEYGLQLTLDSGKMVIDGTAVRQEIMSIPHIMDRLVQHTCSGPVHEKMSDTYPYPGQNAVLPVHRNRHQENHELSHNIVPWATTGVLKNLMLDTTARTTFLEHYSWSISCLCYMSKSKDWLEANKGEGALQHLRIDSDPCWFNYQGTKRNKNPKRKNAKKTKVLCIDRIFIDSTGNTCEAYNDEEALTKDDCATLSIIDSETTASASDACCPCGGGDYYTGPGQAEI